MKSFNTFNKEFTCCLEDWIREMSNNDSSMTIEKREITKSNDQLVHALILTADDIIAAPTIYVEDFYRKYQSGERIKDLQREAMMAFAYGIMNQPKLMDYGLVPESFRDAVVLRLYEIDRNRKWLEDNVYKDMGNGLCAVPYVMLDDGPRGVCCHTVTKHKIRKEGLDEEELFEIAMRNTVRRLPPLLVEACEPALNESKYNKSLNPYNDEFIFHEGAEMYLLTSQSGFNGAIALFYPQLKEIIGELLGSSYYVIPSSINELLIVPANRAMSIEKMERITREINEECVDTSEILSDRIFKYDRRKGRLMDASKINHGNKYDE